MQVKTRALIFQTYISVINHEKNNISHSLTGNSEIHQPLTSDLSVFQIPFVSSLVIRTLKGKVYSQCLHALYI